MKKCIVVLLRPVVEILSTTQLVCCFRGFFSHGGTSATGLFVCTKQASKAHVHKCVQLNCSRTVLWYGRARFAKYWPQIEREYVCMCVWCLTRLRTAHLSRSLLLGRQKEGWKPSRRGRKDKRGEQQKKKNLQVSGKKYKKEQLV